LRLNSLVRCENALVGASGYHRLASFHKDDNCPCPAKAMPGYSAGTTEVDQASRSVPEAAP